MTAAKSLLQYPTSTVDLWLDFKGNGIGIGIGIGMGIGIGIDIGNSLVGYFDSDWATYSVDHKSPGGYVFPDCNEAIMGQSRK
jgi:hypothetical protein